MIGVVPAAGAGTRLQPRTDETPKGLVEVAGKPLLGHVFETLLESGVDRLVVVVGEKAGAIVSRFGESVDGCPITYVHQRERLGLGHAIKQTEPFVDEPFVVLNGDNVLAGTLSRPIARFEQGDVDAVVAVEDGDIDTARETGVVTVEDGLVRDIVEKPDNPPSRFVTTGCYVLSPSIFDALGLVRPSERGEVELPDGLGVLLRAGASVAAVELDAERVNVNTPADLERAVALVERG